LLPDEAGHRRADEFYYKIQLGELREKVPPVRNPTRRPVVFIYTTWDRFVAAEQISDLYSEADHFVDRVFHALQRTGVRPERVWEAERASDDGGAQLRILCQQGEVLATTAPVASAMARLQLSPAQDPVAIEQVIADIRARIAALGGPLTASVPLEY
jgi:hypothetical protein